jgi:hypothetical protein
MSDRRAFVTVCDELYYSMSGRVMMQGIYLQDIVIADEQLQLNQLVFFFTIQTLKSNPFRALSLSVKVPDGEPVMGPIPISEQVSGAADDRRRIIVIKQPLLLGRPLLKPGKIETKVIHESGEIDAGGIWVVPVNEAPPASYQAAF